MQLDPDTNTKENKNRVIRAILFFVGTIALILGILGIALPILPTTPFLLLSLACYLRSSQRMTKWILNNKYFGKYIRNYKEGKGIPIKTKIIAIATLWITIIISIILIQNFWISVGLPIIAIGVTIHLVRLPTCKIENVSKR